MTVLFLFADRVLLARPASASGTSPVFSEPLARGARTAPEAVAEALRTAAAQKDGAFRSGEEVFLLAEDVFYQTVHLASRQLAGLSEAEITQAIAYECAPFSGFSGEDAVTAWRRGETREGETAFEAAQLPAKALRELARAVAAARGRVAGVSGLPAEALTGDAAALSRLVAQAAAQALPQLRAGADWGVWRASGVTGAALFAAVALVTVFWGLSLHRTVRETERHMVEAQRLVAENRALADEIARLRKAPPPSVAGPAGLRAEDAALRRTAWSGLLDAFDAAFSGRGSIQNMERLDAFDFRVTALAPDAAAYEACISTLAQRCAGAGWRVWPERAENVRAGGTSSPWRFVFRLLGPGVQVSAPGRAAVEEEIL